MILNLSEKTDPFIETGDISIIDETFPEETLKSDIRKSVDEGNIYDTVQILLVGESLEHFDEEFIKETVKNVFENGIKNIIKSQEDNNHKVEMNIKNKLPFDQKDYYAKKNALLEEELVAFKKEQKKCEEDSNYPLKWYEKQKSIILEGKKRAHNFLDNSKESFLSVFKTLNINDFDNLSKRTLAATPYEFSKMLEENVYIPDDSVKHRIRGFNTKITKPGEERYSVIGLQMSLKTSDNGVNLFLYEPPFDKHALIHETIHNITKPRVIDNNDGSKTEYRGFQIRHFDLNGNLLMFRNELPTRAIDEGMVAYLEIFFRKYFIPDVEDEDLDNTDNIGQILESSNISSYRVPSLKILDISNNIWMDYVIKYYQESKLDSLLEDIKNNSGEDFLNEWLGDLRKWQDMGL